ncbi:MAG: type II toxin-antitoxin system HipA family toxin [Candidatus Margulisbacteria bacterium]|nr:type II toxin-antitoxin system HipA family toxin [Candidatus Margulisiibacteriota bacterium]
MPYNPISALIVSLDFGEEKIEVGHLIQKNRRIFFNYTPDFLKHQLQISPFKLPLAMALTTCEVSGFEGLHGVFNDSLPDGWGKLLLDRYMRTQGVMPQQLTPLDRLSFVGNNGMGALCYTPQYDLKHHASEPVDLPKLECETHALLDGDTDTFFEELLRLNGSSHGARPKILAEVSHDKTKILSKRKKTEETDSWLIKFKSVQDPDDNGAIEYAYSLMAKEAGLHMPETYLFNNRYFGVKRFDCDVKKRHHMHTLSGLLHADYRIPNLDYKDALKATQLLTKSAKDIQSHFKLAVFNVLAHNRDDHGKNTAYLMDQSGVWHLAPAYDLTFSYGPAGEQSMTIMGEGKNPAETHLIKLAQAYDIQNAKEIIEVVQATINKWPSIAKNAGVTKTSTTLIKNSLKFFK